jgi:hypothetical protein
MAALATLSRSVFHSAGNEKAGARNAHRLRAADTDAVPSRPSCREGQAAFGA